MSFVKKASKHCCVVGCTNNNKNSPETQFYSFPVTGHKSILREKWVNAVKRINPDGSLWQPTKNSRICSAHFIGNEKSEHPHSPSYLPTIFPPAYGRSKQTSVSRKQAVDRFQRSKHKRTNTMTVTRLATPSIMEQEQSTSYVDSPTTTFTTNESEGTQVDISVDASDNMDCLSSTCSTYQSIGTQVDFLEDSNDMKIFLCNIYKTGDAETQANLPLSSKEKTIIKKKKVYVDSGCGCDITYADKQVGPDPVDLGNDSLLICNSGFHGLTSIADDQDLLDLAGVNFSSFNLLWKVYSECDTSKSASKTRLLIFLFKMKLGLSFSALGVLFNVHRTTVSRTFYSVLNCLSQACADFVLWPPKETVRATMPDVFKQSYESCRVIIDCTEFPVEQPPTVAQRVQFYSHYKKGFTIKILVGCTPGGYISFVSKCFGGRTTDAQIINQTGFLNHLEPGDLVLADKGFPEIKTILDDMGKGILLVMPPFLRNNHFEANEVQETQKIASVRIHIERIMQRIKTYRILSKFSIPLLPYADQIVFMSCVLVNLQPPIIKSNCNI